MVERATNKLQNVRSRFSAGNLDNQTLIKIVIVIIVVAGLTLIANRGRGDTPNSKDTRIEVAAAVESSEVNRSFDFPLKDSNGDEVSSINFFIEQAELRNELIVQGKKAGSIKGRTFLVLNIKIKNDFNKAIEVESRDYIRLSVNGNEIDWLAPEIHNDPVSVQPISTKITRVAFTINESDDNYILQIGEINGEKTKVELDLK